MNIGKVANGAILPQSSPKHFVNGLSLVKEKKAWQADGVRPFQPQLKHLLENGHTHKTDEEEDPYAFEEPEQIKQKDVKMKCEQTLMTAIPNSLLHQKPNQIPLYASSPPNTFPTMSVKPRTALPNPPLTVTKPSSCSRATKSIGGKPVNFGKSQMTKLAIAKIEKAIEGKNRGGPKSKPFNALQKTASLSRLINKPKRPTPLRSTSLDCDLAVNKNRSNHFLKQVSQDDCLLESRNRLETEKTGTLLTISQLQTGKPTVPTIPKSPRLVSASFVTDKMYKHESLQRIWNIRNQLHSLHSTDFNLGVLLRERDVGQENESEDESSTLSQKHWFSLSSDDTASNKRDAKLAAFRTELRHKVQQMIWFNKNTLRKKKVELIVESARKQPNLTAAILRSDARYQEDYWRRKKLRLTQESNTTCLTTTSCPFREETDGGDVAAVGCGQPCVPCVGFCERHLLRNSRQLLFGGLCSAETPGRVCGTPVLGSAGATGARLCWLHSRPQDMSSGGTKQHKPSSSQSRRRSRATLGSSRSRKRKRHQAKDKKDSTLENLNYERKNFEHLQHIQPQIIRNTNESISTNWTANTLNSVKQSLFTKTSPSSIITANNSKELRVEEDVVQDELELQAAEVADVTSLLTEHDLTNVLDHIPPDAFTDLFQEDKEEFVPTAQETEELERALEAVDKDMKTLLGVDAGSLPPDVIHGAVYYPNGHGLELLEAATSAMNNFSPMPMISPPQPISADIMQS